MKNCVLGLGGIFTYLTNNQMKKMKRKINHNETFTTSTTYFIGKLFQEFMLIWGCFLRVSGSRGDGLA